MNVKRLNGSRRMTGRPKPMTRGSVSDLDLLVAARTGDEVAVGALVDRHGAAAFRIACLTLNGSHTRAESVVIDAFTDLLTSAHPAGVLSASVRHQLAHRVYRLCTGRGCDQWALESPVTRLRPDGLTRKERVALALILFGDTTCQRAAETVGLPADALLAHLTAAAQAERDTDSQQRG